MFLKNYFNYKIKNYQKRTYFQRQILQQSEQNARKKENCNIYSIIYTKFEMSHLISRDVTLRNFSGVAEVVSDDFCFFFFLFIITFFFLLIFSFSLILFFSFLCLLGLNRNHCRKIIVFFCLNKYVFLIIININTFN
jgi:hypothetical protein